MDSKKNIESVDPERSAIITIGGEEYQLILTTRATKDISARYGGLEKLGERLLKAENFDEALDEICWLITLLANQSILIYNLKHRDTQRDLLTEEAVELLTTPLELASYKEAISQAMFRGTARNIESEPDSGTTTEGSGVKNTEAG